MSGSSHVFIIVSPRPRTGKTLLARLVAEYYQSNARAIGQTEARPIVGYDLSPYEPGLSAFLPNITTQSTLEDTRGQIAPLANQALERIAARSGAGTSAPR